MISGSAEPQVLTAVLTAWVGRGLWLDVGRASTDWDGLCRDGVSRGLGRRFAMRALVLGASSLWHKQPGFGLQVMERAR